MSVLGDKIKKLRKEKGLTQLDLTDNNISRSMLSLIENGLTNPSMTTLQYIADKLEKPLAYFLVDSYEVSEKCESLITSVEQLAQSKRYEEVIKEINTYNQQSLNSNFSYLTNRQSGILHYLLGLSAFNLNQADSLKYLLKAEALLLKADSALYLCKAYYLLGSLMLIEKKYEKMEEYLLKADALISTVTIDNIHFKYKITHNLAFCYYRQQKYKDEIQLINSILLYCQEYEVHYNYGNFNMLLALAYKNNNQINNALECNFTAIRYYDFIMNSFIKHRCYVNISILYRISKDSYNAIYYVNEAIKYFEGTSNTKYLINARIEKLINMFVFDIDSSDINDMAKVLLRHKDVDSLARGELLCILGCLELKKKNYRKALPLFQEAEELIQGNISSEMNIYLYEGLRKLYTHLKKTTEQALYQDKVSALLLQKPYYKDFLGN